MIKTIIGTLFKVIVLIVIFVAGYLAHRNLPIPALEKAIDKATDFCGVKPEEVKKP